MSAPPTPSSSSLPVAAAPSLLTYPAPSPPAAPAAGPAGPAPAPLRKDRLYIGNLHPTVDEYTLLQLAAPHGRVAKLDFLFHRTGPARGTPRGYAFVEYAAKEDALRALVALHGRLVRGRRLVVTFAHQAPHADAARPRPARPTALSLLKTSGRPAATKDKIAAMEAKLRQMEQPAGTAAGAGAGLPPRPVSVGAAPRGEGVRRGGSVRREGAGVRGTASAGPSAGAGAGAGAGPSARRESAPPPAEKPPAPPAPPRAPRPSRASLGIALRR